MLFDLGELDICIPAHLLCLDEFVEPFVRERLDSVLPHVEVADTQVYDSVQLAAAPDVVFKIVRVVADEILFQPPSAEGAVPDGRFRRDFGNQLVVLYLFKCEALCCFVPCAERFHKHEFSRGDLVVYVPSGDDISVPPDVFRLEPASLGVGVRNDEQVECQ